MGATYTLLAWAMENGHEDVMKILLRRGEANPDKPNKYFQTPLSHAPESGHERVVEILLGREDVDPDKPELRSGPSLHCGLAGT